jgi:uncharacterized membrane protein
VPQYPFVNDPRASDDHFPWAWISNIALGAAVLFSSLALARYRTYHNETFDLAFYARMVWGAGRWDLFNPLVGAPLWGLHLSLVLFPLGVLSRFVPLIPLLLITQAVCVAAAGVPLARLAHRRVGHPVAPFVALTVYLLYPVVGSIATYEFHPSSLALFPLALALDWFDRRDLRKGMLALFVAATCREDVALTCGLTGLALALHRRHRAVGLGLFAFFTTWFVLYVFVVAPRYFPREGSLQLHYGHLGTSPGAIVARLFLHPIDTLRALATPVRLLYVPRLLVPVAGLSLLRPRWLLPALGPVAINLLSQFPTATQVHSHYAALVVPFVVVSAAHGVAQVMALGGARASRWGLTAVCAMLVGSIHMQHRAGMLPLLARRHDPLAYRPDERLAALDTVVNLIPGDASVAAPDFLLPHLAARVRIFRYPTLRRPEYLVLSTEHRRRYWGTQELWRNTEEQRIREALSWPRYGVWAVVGDFIVLRRDWPARTYARGRYVAFDPDPGVHKAHVDIGEHLAVAGWGMAAVPGGTRVTLLLAVKRPWPFDLGFELGWGPLRPHLDREDPRWIHAFFPFDGVFMPHRTRVGEVVRTSVVLAATVDELRAHGLRFGARRIDGSRLDARSAHWTLLP